jgi:hypothetical protein
VKAWQDPVVLREAVASASPPLALRADRIAAGRGVPARQVRSAAVALARYQLRAAGRPTPFGLFAGVAGARFGGPALARFGDAHQAAARCEAAWLLSVIERCEACAPLVGRLTVVFVAGGAPRREVGGASRAGPADDPGLPGRAGRPRRRPGPRPGQRPC